MRKYNIVPQSAGKDKGEVNCKAVKFHPKLDANQNVVGFGRLAKPTFRIKLTPDKSPAKDEYDLTNIYTLRWTKTNGHAEGTFTFALPHSVQYPPLRNDNGRQRTNKFGKPYPDLLAQPVTVPDKEPLKVHKSSEMESHLARFMGTEDAKLVMDTLVAAVAEYHSAMMKPTTAAA